jgi:hypothetical protein
MIKEPISPSVDIPLSDAAEELTGAEARTIQQHFREKLENLGSIELTIGLVYTYENRAGNKVGWAAVEGRSIRELSGFFAPEPEDASDDEPDSVSGKDDLPDVSTMPPWPNGASAPVLDRTSI